MGNRQPHHEGMRSPLGPHARDRVPSRCGFLLQVNHASSGRDAPSENSASLLACRQRKAESRGRGLGFPVEKVDAGLQGIGVFPFFIWWEIPDWEVDGDANSLLPKQEERLRDPTGL